MANSNVVTLPMGDSLPTWLQPVQRVGSETLDAMVNAYINHGWRLVPIAKGGKQPTGNKWNEEQNVISSPIMLHKDQGVGLAHAYSGTMALDIDDWDRAETWLSERGINLDELYSDPKAVIIDSGRSGHGKLLYKLIKPLRSIKITDGSTTILEFRCSTSNGKTVQDVLPPSIHPETGKPYQWGDHAGSLKDYLSNIQHIPEQLSAIWHDQIDAHTTIEVTEATPQQWKEIKRALGYISPDLPYDQWITVGMAIHWFSSKVDDIPNGLGIWDMWCSKGKKYKNGEPIKKFNSFQSNTEDSVTIKTLFSMARDNGFKEDVTGLFNTLEYDWREELNDMVHTMNRTHASVLMGKINFIARSTTDVMGRDIYEFIKPQQLMQLYKSDKIQCGERKVAKGLSVPIMKDRISAWLEHKDCRFYPKSVVFNPSDNDPDVFNLWRGLAVEPKKGNASLIYDHVLNIICGGDKLLNDYFLNKVAWKLQQPNKMTGVATIIRGEKGTGKGLIGHFLMSLWGTHGLHISQSSHLVDKFNAHLSNVCFLFADEAFFSGDKKHEGILKALITEQFYMVELKGVDAYQQSNYLEVFMSSNKDFVVPATKDERRYFVLDASNERLGDDAYYEQLYKATQSKDVRSAFLFDMLERDLSGFNVRRVPETKGLKNQREYSLPSHGQFLLHVFETKSNTFTSIYSGKEMTPAGWQDEVKASVLYDTYMNWCNIKHIGSYDRITITAFSRYLNNMYPMIKKADANYRRFGSYQEARDTFYKYHYLD